MSAQPVRIALIQMPFTSDSDANRAQAEVHIREAAAKGAQIICLPEMFTTLYFCMEQSVDHFDLAEPIPGPSSKRLQSLARELDVVLIGPYFEKRAPGIYHNTAVVIDADGTLLGSYRKMHIPQDPGFEEKFYFTPGDLGYRAWETRYGCIGVLICWDQWYPEAARLTAMKGAMILFYPTAIGWLPEEKAELGAAQHTAWETVQRGHAVANGCFVAAVNRVGVEGNTEFWGQSFVTNPYGEVLQRAPVSDTYLLIQDCDLQAAEDFRRIWPFFRDRRIDSYSGITERFSR
ncbi:MAG: carbon-nitrogen hydrolase [Opitutales bacterium]|nr:carbon-nitrogen hydrolase [Opitutales bacterium]